MKGANKIIEKRLSGFVGTNKEWYCFRREKKDLLNEVATVLTHKEGQAISCKIETLLNIDTIDLVSEISTFHNQFREIINYGFYKTELDRIYAKYKWEIVDFTTPETN